MVSTSLIQLAQSHAGRLVAPLMGYPGAHLTDTTLRQNAFNAALHYRSVRQLIERYRPDAAFFMMDLSIEAGAIGLQVRYPLNESPTVEIHPVKSIADLEPFTRLDPMQDARLQSYLDAARRLCAHDDVMNCGYVAGPFTLAGLMCGASELALMTKDDPDLVHAVLRFAEDVITRYARAQVELGIKLIAILEPTASFLSPRSFETFSGAYVRRIADSINAMTVLHVCGDTTRLVQAMSLTGVDGLSLDGPVNFPEIAKVVPPNVVLIGNVDPVRVMVEEKPDGVRTAVRQLVEAMKAYPNFVVSTGCDLPPETPLENIDAFMQAARC